VKIFNLNTDHSKWPVGVSSVLREINVDFLNKIAYGGINRCLAYLGTIRLHFSLSRRTASLQDSNQQIDIPDAKMKSR